MKYPYIKKGFFGFTTKTTDGKGKEDFSLVKFLKAWLSKFGVTFIDPCCPCPQERPVRLIITENSKVLQYYDCELKRWVILDVEDLSTAIE